MLKPMPQIVAKALKFEKDGFQFHSDWNDPLWTDFSNMFKYAVGIGGRDFHIDTEQRYRFKRYFDKYKLRVDSLYAIYCKQAGIVACDSTHPRLHFDPLILDILTKNITPEKLLSAQLDVLSVLLSVREEKEVRLYMPKDCYGENALRCRLKNKDYIGSLEKALRFADCRLEEKEDYLFSSETAHAHAKKLLRSCEALL